MIKFSIVVGEWYIMPFCFWCCMSAWISTHWIPLASSTSLTTLFSTYLFLCLKRLSSSSPRPNLTVFSFSFIYLSFKKNMWITQVVVVAPGPCQDKKNKQKTNSFRARASRQTANCNYLYKNSFILYLYYHTTTYITKGKKIKRVGNCMVWVSKIVSLNLSSV